MTGRQRVSVMRLAAADCEATRDGAWRRIGLRHQRGWPSLEEAIQIQWLPDKTVAMDGDRWRQTMAYRGRLAETSVGQHWVTSDNDNQARQPRTTVTSVGELRE